MAPEESIKRVNRSDTFDVDNIEYTKSRIEEKQDRGSGTSKEIKITLAVIAIIAVVVAAVWIWTEFF